MTVGKVIAISGNVVTILIGKTIKIELTFNKVECKEGDFVTIG